MGLWISLYLFLCGRPCRFYGTDGVTYFKKHLELVNKHPTGYRSWVGPLRPLVHLVRPEDVAKVFYPL